MKEPFDKNQESTIEEAVRQFVDEKWQGRQPDIEKFVKQYPQLENKIRQRILDVQKIDTLFDSLVHADENDFEDSQAGQNLLGQKIGNFEIVEVIGSGGMGIVYLAHDPRLNRSVAIKSVPAQLKDDSNARMRFKREAEILASLNHPGIAVIYDIIAEDDSAGFLVLEYVPGETLAERIAHGPLELEQALSIARQIAEAVSAAHKKGIIHRDLKPGNIKLTPGGKAKVLDFGLAKPFETKDTDIQITSTEPGHIIGTPAYMSPEQARGKETDHRTDIWSFGCIMYQMLTGTIPFEGQTATDILAHIIDRQPDWNILPKETPENIRILLSRCLEKNPDQRLGDIADAAMEITETLNKPLITPASKLRKMAMILSAVTVCIILFFIASKFIPKNQVQSSTKEISLAVLPFENLGPEEDEYFATGLTDEIAMRLAGIQELRVYKNKDKMTKKNIRKLGVDYILEGTLQREQRSDPNSRLRIRPQLLRASDDSLVWAQSYDDNEREILRTQSDVAEQVAQNLDMILLEPLVSRPTENMIAYGYYLRGKDYYNRSWSPADWKISIKMYNKAIELDPNFALAYAVLSLTHAHTYWHAYDRSKKRLALAQEAVLKALELDPDLPEAHIAMGYYHYWGHLDYEQALKEFAIAQKIQPNDSELLFDVALVQRRQGKIAEALENIKKAVELNPLTKDPAIELGYTCLFLRQYKEAEQYYDRTISLFPDWHTTYFYKAILYLIWKGDTKLARKTLDEAYKATKRTSINISVRIDLYEGNYQQALEQLTSRTKELKKPVDLNDQFTFRPMALRIALIYEYMGNTLKAQEHYQQSVDILKTKIAEDPNETRYYSSIGIAYAGLGQKEEAVKYGKLAVKMLPVSKEAMKGPFRRQDMALIYVMIGKYNEAIDEIEYLLSIPGQLSISMLKIDPDWAPLRNHPDFKKLIETSK